MTFSLEIYYKPLSLYFWNSYISRKFSHAKLVLSLPDDSIEYVKPLQNRNYFLNINMSGWLFFLPVALPTPRS
jgi:hypothetical protein